jgi:hypothetical protein
MVTIKYKFIIYIVIIVYSKDWWHRCLLESGHLWRESNKRCWKVVIAYQVYPFNTKIWDIWGFNWVLLELEREILGQVEGKAEINRS